METSVRPLYESEEDLQREREVADQLEGAWKVTLSKMPMIARIDFSASRERQVAGWVEIKCRFVDSDTYGDLMLSRAKHDAGKALAAQTGLPFVLAVKFDDGIYYSDETNKVRREGMGGRNNRNDPKDKEPVVYIPLSDFKPLRREK